MTDLDQAVLDKLTARYETAAMIIQDLRDEPRFKGNWKPGDVLAALERLAVLGKAEFDLAKGYRLMPDRPVKDNQGRMFQ